MKRIQRGIERYLLVWLMLLCAVAFFESSLPIHPFSAVGPYLKLLIVITMVAVGWMLPRDEIQQVIRRWPTVLGGTAIQYGAMPLLAYWTARQFPLSAGIRIGIVMVGCVPGAMASNVLTLMAKGNAGYSVSLTTMATLLSPLIVPLTMALALQESVDQQKLTQAAVELTWMVVLPVTAGHLLARAFPRSQQAATTIGSIVANLTILWIVAFVVATNHSQLQQVPASLLGALLGLNLLGYLAGNLGGAAMRLPPGMRRALTLEVGMQNAGLGTTLVTSLFPDDPSVAIPTALYTFGCMFTGTVLARVWSTASSVEAVEGQETGR